MNKKISLLFLSILFFLFYFFNIHKDVEKKLLTLIQLFKIEYTQSLINIDNSITQFYQQASNIENLQKQILISKMNKVPLLQLQQEIKDLKNFNQDILPKNDVITTRALYLRYFSDFTQVWLDFGKKDSSINGIITNDTVAGIVILKDNKALGLLNQNPNCNYGVFIGKAQAPGITHGIKGQSNIKIKYIPSWYYINIGDEVVTSGMDNIFFKGLKVGRVLSIKKESNSLEAIVKPYSDTSIQRYYYLYINKKPLENQLLTK